MSKPKRHHFVPQFYLRRFSADGRSICCFHKKSETFIPRAPIKGQCAIDNYYSWHEGVEPALGVVEGRIAAIMREVADFECLPDEDSVEWQELLMFVALQAGRTRLSGDASDAMADYFAKLMAQGRPEFDGIDLSKIKIGTNYPAALPMELSIQSYGVLNSLDRALLINTSKVPFLCSDNPVVFYNSQRSHIQDHGVIGLDSSGLQIFFALDPKLSIYLFDGSVYSRPSNTGIRKPRLEDVLKMNLVHFMWSDQAVYCSRPDDEAVIRELSSACRPYIPFERVVFRESRRITKDDGTASSLLHNFRAQVPIEADFSFSKHQKKMDEMDTGQRSRRRRTRAANDGNQRGTVYEFVVDAESRNQLGGAALRKALKTIERRAA